MPDFHDSPIVLRNFSHRPNRFSSYLPLRSATSRVTARLIRRLQKIFEKSAASAANWSNALRALALARGAEAGDLRARDLLQAYVDDRIDVAGKWLDPLHGPPQALDGYVLLILHRLAPSSRYGMALKSMAHHFVTDSARLDECLPYTPGGTLLLVDSLGMLCPFLAGYGRDFQDRDAVALARTQLLRFVELNLDSDSRLPFHGYFAGGPYRLGAHGWGRGVGWFLIGLVDTLLELDAAEDGVESITSAIRQCASTLRTFQHPDGNWSWVVPLSSTSRDSSVAAFCGYALTRARRAGIVEFNDVISQAYTALMNSAAPDGTIGESSGECRGLTEYSDCFGPQPWVQGMGAAFVIELSRETR